jgi:phage terminase large subunit-like protein
VVGEGNFGGAMVEFVIKTANPSIPYKTVNASRGKHVRAEPISALTEMGKIKFVGEFPDLEDELLGFTTTGYTGARSPNRADWFIWAMTELMPIYGADTEETEEIQVNDYNFGESEIDADSWLTV